eukprot:TRINITY_DN9956_c0_g1_i1.p1 TRINITY_DN9956_c0_g1~~TRINITY_DN9956_c0_g1_i1.p1  ORF type:complete len:473 (+),score=7.96 TRINITY_DN9956_c0_g1_i1:178-1596(+)
MTCLSTEMRKKDHGHVVVVAYPAQGHMNPLLHFAKRLACLYGLHVTFVTSDRAKERMKKADENASALSIRFETFSDGLPEDFNNWNDLDKVDESMRREGSRTLSLLLHRLNADPDSPRVTCVVYDSFMYWVPPVARQVGAECAFLWTQCSAVLIAYYKAFLARTHNEETMTHSALNAIKEMEIPNSGFEVADLPSFLQPSDPYAKVLDWIMKQFDAIDDIRWFLGNSFDGLESEQIERLNEILPSRFLTVGPLVPSGYLDGRIAGDDDSGAHMWKATNCSEWLESMSERSVLYVSFGSLAVLSKEQIFELAVALRDSGHPFLWVVRPSSDKGTEEEPYNEDKGFPTGFIEEIRGRGMVVGWCPQMRVLSHPSVGAFLSHCGWNSSLEGITQGVPTLCVPQWSDQTTNSALISKVWRNGVRVQKDPVKGVVCRDEFLRCIRMVMEDEELSIRQNADFFEENGEGCSVERRFIR